MTEFPDYARVNQDHWNRQAPGWVDAGRRHWAGAPEWGMWGIPNEELPLLPDDLSGCDAIELGCGTAYVSAWMARRGARVTAIDPAEGQLDTARALAAEHGLPIDFVHGVAEAVPRPDASFDLAISEYGAAIWADPYAWIPEAFRLLKPGGRLVFLGHTPWAMVTTPHTAEGATGDRLLHPYFGMHRFDWTDVEDDSGIEFCLTAGDWFRLFRQVGFAVDDYREVRAPADARGVRFATDAAWARDYPSEQVWFLRRVDPR